MNRTVRRLFSGLLLLILFFFLARHTNLFPAFKNPFKPKPILVNETPLLVTQVKSMAQLLTMEAYNEVVVDSVRYPFGVPPRILGAIPGNALSLFSGAQLVLIVRGKVVAGVNLQALDSNHIKVRGDSLFIQLPPTRVLDVITNPSDIEIFIEKGTWNEAASTALKQKARNQLVQQALAQGVLQQADARARQLVYELFKNTKYKQVFVTTGIQVRPPSGKQ
jgi:hypothetical protein